MRVKAADVSAPNHHLDLQSAVVVPETVGANPKTKIDGLPASAGCLWSMEPAIKLFTTATPHQSNPLIPALGHLLGEGPYGCWALEDPSWPLLWPLTLMLIPKQKLELMWTNTVWPRPIEEGSRRGRGLSSTVPKTWFVRWRHCQVWLFNSSCDSEGSLRQRVDSCCCCTDDDDDNSIKQIKKREAIKTRRGAGGRGRRGQPGWGSQDRRAGEGLAFTQAAHWCAARPFEGIINTFWLLWSTCHTKYNLQRDYESAAAPFFSLKQHFPSPLVPETSPSLHCVASRRGLCVRWFKEHPAFLVERNFPSNPSSGSNFFVGDQKLWSLVLATEHQSLPKATINEQSFSKMLPFFSETLKFKIREH